MKLLTRSEVVDLIGEAMVSAAEAKNCEPTGRIGTDGCEWSASHTFESLPGTECTITVLYHTTHEQDELMAATGDGASIDWKISGYTVFGGEKIYMNTPTGSVDTAAGWDPHDVSQLLQVVKDENGDWVQS